ncbi:MAG: sugar transferase [Dehalococcoidia bacterium]
MKQRILQGQTQSGTDHVREAPAPSTPGQTQGGPQPTPRGLLSRYLPLAPLLTADVLAIGTAFAAAPLLASAFGHEALPSPVSWLWLLPLLLLGFAAAGVYTASVAASPAASSIRAAFVLSLGGMGIIAGLVANASSYESIVLGAVTYSITLLLVPLARTASHPIVRWIARSGVGRKPMVVVGTYPEVQSAVNALQSHGVYRLGGMVIVGEDGANETASLPMEPEAEFLLVAAPSRLSQVEQALRPFVTEGSSVYIDLAALQGSPAAGSVTAAGHGLAAVQFRPNYDSWRYRMVKRSLDLIIAASAIVAAAPLMLLVALAIKLDSPGSILFKQTRVGRNSQPFPMYKFRSMRSDAEALQEDLLTSNEAQGPMFKIREDPRMTRVGRFIRRTSVDELPQLFNVLQGSMSIVGPRPPLPQEVMKYEPWQLRRLELTPGITGLWQVNRSELSSFEEMVQMDIDYTDRWSLGMEMRILAKTPLAVVSAKGAY